MRRPCRRGEFANAASSTGPSACTAAQRAATAAALARVDADLDGRRGAHGAAPVRADAVERLLHRAVARQIQQALRRAVRAAPPGLRRRGPRRAARRCSASASAAVVASSPARSGSGGLASSIWPPGSTVTREPPGSGSAGEDGSRATGQCLPSAVASGAAGEPVGGAGPHQPLQLHAGEQRGTVLETHRRDVGLGRCAVAQHRRLAALLPGDPPRWWRARRETSRPTTVPARGGDSHGCSAAAHPSQDR